MSGGTLTWLAPEDPHPARDAQRNALRHAMAGDRDGWLALWAEDCEIHDPVGVGPFDPDGSGFHGRAGAAAFWEAAIPVHGWDVEVRRSYAAGDSSAQEATFTIGFAEGGGAAIDMVVVYRVDDAGLITSMRAYWEGDRVRLVGPGS
jgi:ketosteroid isomerase-like protein